MYCEKPNIILSKTLYRHLTFGRRLVYTNGTDIYPIHGRLPSPTVVGATADNYKDWSILTEDGELIPMFVAVPCGKCILCREKKAKEWSTRATCETAAATYPPIFVTLTYAPGYLPFDGVEKDDVQKFLKRFRENWYRKYKQRLNLRYFAAAEYGDAEKTAIPHYHLLMWNIPHGGENDLLGLRKIYDVIARSWSEPCSKKWYDSLPKKRYKFLQLEYDERYYVLFGKIDVSPDRGLSAPYCMKYMRKPKDVPFKWTNPTFYLSSRRNGGIGVPYLTKQMESLRRCPGTTTIETPYQMTTQKYSLPRLFKDKLFPSLSCLLPLYVRMNIARFEEMYQVLRKDAADDVHDMLYHMRQGLRNQYGRCYDFINAFERLYQTDSLCKIPKGYHNYKVKNDIFLQLQIIFVQLFDYQPNLNALERFISLKDKRMELLARLKVPEVDVSYEKYRIKNKINKAKLRSVF